jgi:hypothetical protein
VCVCVCVCVCVVPVFISINEIIRRNELRILHIEDFDHILIYYDDYYHQCYHNNSSCRHTIIN